MRVDNETKPPDERSRAQRRADLGVAANARLTATNAAVLIVLLAAEGATILRVRQLISPHDHYDPTESRAT